MLREVGRDIHKIGYIGVDNLFRINRMKQVFAGIVSNVHKWAISVDNFR